MVQHRKKPEPGEASGKAPVKKGRKPPPPGETAHERFLRLGHDRIQKALYQMKLLGNLSNPGYKWYAEDIEMMRKILYTALSETFRRFGVRPAGDPFAQRFRFPSAPEAEHEKEKERTK